MKFKFLNRFKHKEVEYIDGMKKDQANIFLAEADVLNNNKTLKLMFEKLRQNRGNFIALKACTLDEVFSARGGINDLYLLEEEIRKYADIKKDSTAKKELFDKFDII